MGHVNAVTAGRIVHRVRQCEQTYIVFASADKQLPTRAWLPRVRKQMEIAIRFDQLICYGMVSDKAELARLGAIRWAVPGWARQRGCSMWRG